MAANNMEPEPPTDAQYEERSRFLTVEKLFEFRFLTTMLSFSNGLDRAESATHDLEDLHGHLYEDAQHQFLFDNLTHLANLFVRHTEVVAVTASAKMGASICVSYEDPDFDDVEFESDSARSGSGFSEQNAVLSSGGRVLKRDAEGNTKLDPDDKARKKRHLSLEIGLENAVADVNLNNVKMAAWLLSHTKRTTEFGKYLTTDVPFAEHCANVIKLIKDTHSAVDINAARSKLRDYVLLNSCARIHGRLVGGVDELNLFKFVVSWSKTIATTMDTSDLRKILNLAGCGDAVRPFTRQERTAVLKLCRFLNEYLRKIPAEDRNDEVKFDSDRIATFQELLEDEAHEVSYNVETIISFQVLISNIVLNANGAVDDLVKFKRKAQIHRIHNFDEWPTGPAGDGVVSFQTNIASLNEAVNEAGTWLRALSEMLEQLRPFVLANFACIRIKFDLDQVERTDQNLASAMHPSCSRLPDKDFTVSSSFPGSGTGREESSRSEEFVTEDTKDSRIQDECYAELSSSIDMKNWDKGAYEWLRLICSQTFAYTTLSRNVIPNHYDRKIAKAFGKAELSVIKPPSRYSDHRLYIREYLDEFTHMQRGKLATFSDDDKTSIIDWLTKYGHGFIETKHLANSTEESMSAGSYHCETLLISLYLLGEMRNELVNPDVHDDSSLESEALHLKLPSKELTDKLRNALDVLAVTRPCCPACHALIEYIRTRGYKPDMFYKDNHRKKWSQSCLPPFIPKEAGEAVIAAAKRALKPRLCKMIKIMKKERRLATNRAL